MTDGLEQKNMYSRRFETTCGIVGTVLRPHEQIPDAFHAFVVGSGYMVISQKEIESDWAARYVVRLDIVAALLRQIDVADCYAVFDTIKKTYIAGGKTRGEALRYATVKNGESENG